ncbi:hypothetical protein JIO05_03095 [Pediococcus acidilactici]|uniref:hypothetical protein n=1 Tax=Pediococcus acidilactici TaxID=1254 RepID=UPI0019120F1B|nr:hypothetical protein [Pediococcus acidilactici]MDC8307943.1 hypothetical protein [Lacticaseibacillus rhamnosus]QQP83911.1 hypothetical protein JIO05_03095 [Pediococcus acidilactici]
MLKEFRKTATIKAEQFDGSAEMIEKYGIVKENFVIDGWGPTFSIPTLEGGLAINIGDWIATGVDGEHWPIADDIFRKTYEEVG